MGYNEEQQLQDALRARGATPAAPRVGSRGLPPRQPASAPAEAPQDPHGPVGGMLRAGPGGATPFAANQLNLGSNVAPSSANSMRVLFIVFGTGFMIAMAVLASLAILVITVFNWQKNEALDPNKVKKVASHKRDTGLVNDPDIKKLNQRIRRNQIARENAPKDPMAQMFGGIGAAPVTVYTKGPGKELYRGIEIICGQVNYRKRAPIINNKAHIAIVPAARCRLVFQGNVPLKSWVTGGDTVTCSFNPIVCR